MQYKYKKKKIHYIFVFDMMFRDLFDFVWIVNVVAAATESIESFIIYCSQTSQKIYLYF
jgi:hypothetical protein